MSKFVIMRQIGAPWDYNVSPAYIVPSKEFGVQLCEKFMAEQTEFAKVASVFYDEYEKAKDAIPDELPNDKHYEARNVEYDKFKEKIFTDKSLPILSDYNLLRLSEEHGDLYLVCCDEVEYWVVEVPEFFGKLHSWDGEVHVE